MSIGRFTFGPRLKAHRERQEITLREIAQSTKIGIAVLAGLESNDVTRWPTGIYRRAFLRSYTDAIGLPFEATWAEFSSLFPEDGTAPSYHEIPPADLRLTLARGRFLLLRPNRLNALAALCDLGATLAGGLIAARLGGWPVATCIAVVGVSYSALATLLAGGSLARRYLRVPAWRAPALAPVTHAEASVEPTSPQDALPVAHYVAGPALVPRPRIVASHARRHGSRSAARHPHQDAT